jgi:hypothetical protein
MNAAAADVIRAEEAKKKKDRKENKKDEELKGESRNTDEESEEDAESERKRERRERRAKGKPRTGVEKEKEKKGHGKKKRKRDTTESSSSSSDSGSRRRRDRRKVVVTVTRKTVKDALSAFTLRPGASDREVRQFIHNATTQSRVHGWVHSEYTYQGILATLPGDLIQCLGEARTYEGVLTALKAVASVKTSVTESEQRMEMRRELNDLKQKKKQSVGRYVGEINEVLGRFSDLRVEEEEVITIFVANLIPILHHQLKSKTFTSLNEAVAAAQKKEIPEASDGISLPDAIADGRRRGAFVVGRDGAEDEEDYDQGGASRYGADGRGSSINALIGALGQERDRKRQKVDEEERESALKKREDLVRERVRHRELELVKRERDAGIEEEKWKENEERRMQEREKAVHERTVAAISRNLSEVRETERIGAPLWCAHCYEMCQHDTAGCVRSQRVEQAGRGRGRGYQGGRGRGGSAGLCHSCNRPGHDYKTCPESVCYACQGRGHLSYDCPTRTGGVGVNGGGRGAQVQQAIQYSQVPMGQLQYNPQVAAPIQYAQVYAGPPVGFQQSPVQQAQGRVAFNPVPVQQCLGFEQKGAVGVSAGQGDGKRIVDALGTTMDDLNQNLSGGGVRPPSQLPQARG